MSRPAAQLSSSRLAALAGAANLVLCAAVGTSLILTSRSSTPETASSGEPAQLASSAPSTPYPTTTSRRTTTTRTTSTTTSSTVPMDLEPISGPAGLTTVIPRGWPTKTLPEPGSMQATDPADTKRILKFGGAEPEYSADIHTYHVNYEQQVAKRPGYVLFGLSRTVVRGYEAIDWEFESTTAEGRRHVRSIYWRSGGVEYYVYAHSPISRWPETLEVLKAMRDNATP